MADEGLKKRFGLAIKRWRSQTGISQEKLAFRSKLHRTYICDIERGSRNPTLQSIGKLAQALNVSLPVLLQTVETSTEDRHVKNIVAELKKESVANRLKAL